MKTTKEIYADVMQKDMVKTVIAKQYDCNSRFLCVRFASYGVIMQAAQDDVAIVNVQRSDGEAKAFRGTVNEDGSVTVPLTSWMSELAGRRREKQPLEYPSAGSTFKRPEGYFAGKLIMDAGLRGYTVGGAQVSEKHCGFVINRGNA